MKVLAYLLAALLMVLAAACSGEPQEKPDMAPVGSADSVAEEGTAPSPRPERAAPRTDTIWQGRVKGYRMAWTGEDFTARSGAAAGTAVSLREVLDHRYRMAIDTLDDSEFFKDCTTENTVKVLSVVGSTISIERSEYGSCPGAAHPSVNTTYESFSLANPDRVLTLGHYYDERTLYDAIAADPLVKKAMASAGITSLPATLPEFLDLLSTSVAECEYGFSREMLSSFAFHHIEGNRVAVRIGLSHGAGACRGRLTQLGLLLPIPSALADDLRAADNRTAGYLMRDLKKIAGDGSTMITLK